MSDAETLKELRRLHEAAKPCLHSVLTENCVRCVARDEFVCAVVRHKDMLLSRAEEVERTRETVAALTRRPTIGADLDRVSEAVAAQRDGELARAMLEVVAEKGPHSSVVITTDGVKRIAECMLEVESLRAEVERLNAVLRQTHSNYCNEAYTGRGMHAPECLLYEIEDSAALDAADREGES